MARRSAGLLLYRLSGGEPEVLLVHPGGPFWARKDEGAWSIPKGEYEPDEAPLTAALREFQEETGVALRGTPRPLGDAVQPSRKIVTAFALEGDLDPAEIRSIDFEVEWPPRSGRKESFPEAEEARWMSLAEARELMLPSQLPLLDALEEKLRG